MSNTYVIQWKSQVNGRAGRGTKQFSREEAEQLVHELNQEYPQIVHEVAPWRPPPEALEEEQEQPAAESHPESKSSTHQSPTSHTYKTQSRSAAKTPDLAIR